VRGDTSNIEGGDQIIPDLANVALGGFMSIRFAALLVALLTAAAVLA